MNKPILLSLLTILCTISCCRATTPRLWEKHGKCKCGIIQVSGIGKEIPDFFSSSNIRISGDVKLEEYAQAQSSIMNDSTCIREIIRGFFPGYMIQPTLWSYYDSMYHPIPFANITIGKKTYSYGSMAPSGQQKIIMSNRTGDTADFASLFDQTQTMTMTDTNGKLLFSANVYAPAILIVNPVPDYDEKVRLNVNLHDGLNLYWNADTNNTSGIRIEMRDVNINCSCTPTYEFYLPDNGSFKMPKKYLVKFLKNKPKDKKFTMVYIRVFRGGQQIVTGSDGRNYSATTESDYAVFMKLQ